MKRSKVSILFIGLLLLAGCEKLSPERLQGRWEPVYACGSFEHDVYLFSFDGAVDERGYVPLMRVRKDSPDVKFEDTLLIPGILFFQKDGEDVYISFHKDSPKKMIGKPLMYKIENGMLYFEMPQGAFTDSSPEVLEKGSGEFDEGAAISFLAHRKIKIGGITYKRM